MSEHYERMTDIASFCARGDVGNMRDLNDLDDNEQEDVRIDPTLGDKALTFSEMCRALADQDLNYKQLRSHWADLKPAPDASAARAQTLRPDEFEATVASMAPSDRDSDVSAEEPELPGTPESEGEQQDLSPSVRPRKLGKPSQV